MPAVQGGSPIRNANTPWIGGTVACIVESRTIPGRRYLLTAGHVIGMNGLARPGDAVETSADGGKSWFKVGQFIRSVPLRDDQGFNNVCDAAIALISPDIEVSEEIKGVGRIRGISEGLYRDKVLKYFGAKGGLRQGIALHSTGAEVSVTYDELDRSGTFTLGFTGQILYGSHDGGEWLATTQGTDSGTLVVDEANLAVGLHMAVTPPDAPPQLSICTPIGAVLDALGCRIPGLGDERVEIAAGVADAPAPAAPDEMPLADRLGILSQQQFGTSIRSMLEPHTYYGEPQWVLTKDGVAVNGVVEGTPGRLITVPRLWNAYQGPIMSAARQFKVPVELILATIHVESGGQQDALRVEEGWLGDSVTPRRVSAGLMQTLLATARESLGDLSLTRAHLFEPGTSIRAGTAYIGMQRKYTRLDPPLVACAYNAGSLRPSEPGANRWGLVQTGNHADRFVQSFNDCFALFNTQPDTAPRDAPSFFRLFKG